MHYLSKLLSMIIRQKNRVSSCLGSTVSDHSIGCSIIVGTEGNQYSVKTLTVTEDPKISSFPAVTFLTSEEEEFL